VNQFLDADYLAGVVGKAQQQPHGSHLDASRLSIA